MKRTIALSALLVFLSAPCFAQSEESQYQENMAMTAQMIRANESGVTNLSQPDSNGNMLGTQNGKQVIVTSDYYGNTVVSPTEGQNWK